MLKAVCQAFLQVSQRLLNGCVRPAGTAGSASQRAAEQEQDARHHQRARHRPRGVEQHVGQLRPSALDEVLVQFVQRRERRAANHRRHQLMHALLMLEHAGEADAQQRVEGEVRDLAQRVVVPADQVVGGFAEEEFQQLPQRTLAGLVGDLRGLRGKQEDRRGNRDGGREPKREGDVFSVGCQIIVPTVSIDFGELRWFCASRILFFFLR